LVIGDSTIISNLVGAYLPYPVNVPLLHNAVKNGKATDKEVFASGWLRHGRKWGRPVDLLVMADGSLLVSDDLQGAVYRIYYRGRRQR